ncbi:MAG: STAS domain-containing protein [Acidobacteria bacterium]|nr:STAS domain-containing protein [Acidobacteriota bacterium]
MKIEVTEERDRDNDALVLVPVGSLDSGNAHSFESIVMEHVNNGERRLIVDFSRLHFVSSAGLRVFVIAARALRARKGQIVLCAMRNHVEDVFRVSGIYRVIAIQESRAAAVDALG